MFFPRRRSRGLWRKVFRTCWWNIISSAGTSTAEAISVNHSPVPCLCVSVLCAEACAHRGADFILFQRHSRRGVSQPSALAAGTHKPFSVSAFFFFSEMWKKCHFPSFCMSGPSCNKSTLPKTKCSWMWSRKVIFFRGTPLPLFWNVSHILWKFGRMEPYQVYWSWVQRLPRRGNEQSTLVQSDVNGTDAVLFCYNL